MIIPYHELQIRISSIPDELMGAIYDKKNDDVLDQLQEQLIFSDDIKFSIEEEYQLVFLGFLRQKDFFEELVQVLKLDSKTALVVYQELDREVFGPYKTQIEENYRAFQSAPQQPVEFPQTQEQVVLKNPIAEGAVNLKQGVGGQESGVNKNIVSEQKQSIQPAPTSGPAPTSLDALGMTSSSRHNSDGADNKGLAASEGQISVQQKGEIEKASGKEGVPPISSQQPTNTSDNAPFILHKHEDAVPIAQSQPQKGYRQMSFGSFMGSFRTPQSKQQEISQAQVEIPGIPVSAPGTESISPAMQKNTPTAIPFSVKKYVPENQSQVAQVGKETARVIHYTSDGEQK